MKKGHNHGVVNCKILYERVSRNNTTLNATYYHILRKNNAFADKMENKGTKNNLGIVSIRDQQHYKYVSYFLCSYGVV